jgi:hypothetical protein
MNQEITDYIINVYGEMGLDQIISGELLVNDKKLNELITEYYRIVGYTNEKRVFTVPVGKMTAEEANNLISEFKFMPKSSLDILIPANEHEQPFDNIRLDLKYFFSKVKTNTVRFKNGKLKIRLRPLKQYFQLLGSYITYITLKPFSKPFLK